MAISKKVSKRVSDLAAELQAFIDSFDEALQELIQDQEAERDEKSERWLESAAADAHQEWLDELQSLSDDLNEMRDRIAPDDLPSVEA